MEPLAFVMAILGCGEGDQACTELRLAPSRYESQAACLAATEDVLARQDDLYPVIVAQCRRSTDRAAAVPASEVTLPAPESTPAFPAEQAPAS